MTEISTPAATAAPTLTTTTPAAATTQAAPEFWGASLPEDLRGNETLAKYNSLEAAARGLAGAVKLIGERPENLVKLPAGGDAEATRAVLQKLGLPDKLDDRYNLSAFEGAGEGLSPSGDLAQVFKAASFEAGILPGQMQAVYEKVGQMIQGLNTDNAAKIEAKEAADMEVLQKTFGGALDDTLTRADIVAGHFGLAKELNAAGLGTNPGVVKLLSTVFPLIQEASGGGRETGQALSGAKSPAEYTAQAMDLQRQAMAEKSPSRRVELATAALRLRQLANAGR